MIEGMSLGRTAIATDVAGHSEWITHGTNGFLADGCSIASLDSALEEAWRVRKQAHELGLEARRTAQKILTCNPIHQLSKVIECELPDTVV